MADVSSYDTAAPAGSDNISAGDNDIRSKAAVMFSAWDDEHYFDPAGVSSSAASGGVHRPGSARAFSQSAAPTAVLPVGQLWHDTDTDILYVAEAAGTGSWTQLTPGSTIASFSTAIGAWTGGTSLAAQTSETTTVTMAGASDADTFIINNTTAINGNLHIDVRHSGGNAVATINNATAISLAKSSKVTFLITRIAYS